MVPHTALVALATLQTAAGPDPLRLPIGEPGERLVTHGYTEMATGRALDAAGVAAMADGKRFVLLGESHDNPHHHRMQVEVILALLERGRDVVVGLEMFTRPAQPKLAPWTLGWWTEEEFIERSGWRTEWGFDFALYRPVFEAVRDHRLPMVALNVPRDWVRAVGRGGPEALTEEQRRELPDLYLGNAEHRKVFEALIGGHPLAGDRGRNMYAAQVLWDEAMADTALRYFDRRAEGPRTVMVILAGSGHAMYRQGIDWRITRRTGERVLTLVGTEAAGPVTVARGLADVVYVSPVVERAPR
jgi:uncharacterized iron-regulated protein